MELVSLAIFEDDALFSELADGCGCDVTEMTEYHDKFISNNSNFFHLRSAVIRPTPYMAWLLQEEDVSDNLRAMLDEAKNIEADYIMVVTTQHGE